MPVPLASLGNLTVIDCLDWAYMQAPQTFHTMMLPNRLSLRPLDVFPGTDSLTQAAGGTFILIAQESFIYSLLLCQPFIMVSATKVLQQLPRRMIFPVIYGRCNTLQFPFC